MENDTEKFKAQFKDELNALLKKYNGVITIEIEDVYGLDYPRIHIDISKDVNSARVDVNLSDYYDIGLKK